MNYGPYELLKVSKPGGTQPAMNFGPYVAGDAKVSGTEPALSDRSYEFTIDFFGYLIPFWEKLFKDLGWYLANKPLKALEIGCFEGRSTTWLLDFVLTSKGSELFCCDTFEGSLEHRDFNITDLEQRFRKNVAAASRQATIHIFKSRSSEALPKILSQGHAASFDFVYVDGSHQAADVLFDLVLAFELAKVGGLMIADDYLWEDKGRGETDILTSPKLAMDAFVNINRRRLEIMPFHPQQLYLQKTRH